MKRYLLLFVFLSQFCGAREVNLINNADFGRGLLRWSYDCAGTSVSATTEGVSFSDGMIFHYLDLGNLEHADPECTMPANRTYRFRIRAKGEGTIRLGIRARLMRAGNAIEFATRWSAPMSLGSHLRNFEFEAVEKSPDVVFHDKLAIQVSGKAVVASACFFYLDCKTFFINFSPEAAVVRPGDQVKVNILTSQSNRKLDVDLYCGQTRIGGYDGEERHAIMTGADGKAEFSFTVPLAAPDGARLAVSDPATGVKKSFFATILPSPMLETYLEKARHITGKKHILYLGDSLTDYDRGRNYVSITGCFLPSGWTSRNAGVGGDTLGQIFARLTGQKATRPEMYANLFTPVPDVIFLLCGANDTKANFRSEYRETETPGDQQIFFLNSILDELKRRAPQAQIILFTAPDSYLPAQLALAAPLVKAKINHNLFGLPKHVDAYNTRLKKIAGERKIPVYDLVAFLRSTPNRQQLYVPDDGVHLSLEGHQFVAGMVLQALSLL